MLIDGYMWLVFVLRIPSEVVSIHQDLTVMCFIFRFAVLASRMEQYIQGQSRDLIDKAYTKLVSFIAFQSCTSLHLWYYIAKLGHEFQISTAYSIWHILCCGLLSNVYLPINTWIHSFKCAYWMVSLVKRSPSENIHTVFTSSFARSSV